MAPAQPLPWDGVLGQGRGLEPKSWLTPGSALALWRSRQPTVTLAKAGTYYYHCSIHPFMTGEIDATD